MAEQVVHPFELVEVKEHQAQHQPLLLGMVDGLANQIKEQHTVGQSGQPVVVGQLAHLGTFLVRQGQAVLDSDKVSDAIDVIEQRRDDLVDRVAAAVLVPLDQLALPGLAGKDGLP
ncbi:hypothetical protein FQZ97_675990 [compost metagenome]